MHPNKDLEIPPLDKTNVQGDITLNAIYKKPYIMHGTIGPSSGAAFFDGQELKFGHRTKVYTRCRPPSQRH